MSQEDVAVLHRVYEAVRRRDLDGCLREMDPEVEGVAYVMSLDGEVFRGHDGFRRFLEKVLEVFPDWNPAVVDTEILGDILLVNLRTTAHGAGSSVPIDYPSWQLATFREGKVRTWRGFATRAEALEAAGLRE